MHARYAAIISMMLAAFATQSLAMGDRPASQGRMDELRVIESASPVVAPDVGFMDAQGREWRISHFRGQVLLLNFWATWCPPCVKEMPAFDRLQARYGAAGLRVIPISQDRSIPNKPVVTRISEFYQQYGITQLGLFYAKDTMAYSQMGIPGLPTTVIIDRQGRERARIKGVIEWESQEFAGQLEQLLSEQ